MACITNFVTSITHRKPYYFLLFMLRRKAQQSVGLELLEMEDNNLLFILPHSIHSLPLAGGGVGLAQVRH